MRIFKIALLVLFAASTLLGTAGSASASTGCTPAGTFQDDNPNGFSPHVDFVYGPGWDHRTNYGDFGLYPYEPRNRTTSFTNHVYLSPSGIITPGSYGIVAFNITCRDSFDFFYSPSFNRAIADVYARTSVGWEKVASVDQYSPVIEWQSARNIPLPPGTVQVAIVNSGRTHLAATDRYIDFDGITPR